MTHPLLDRLRHETRFVVHISVRDLAKRLASFGMIAAVCWHAGIRGEVLVLAGIIIAVEVAARILHLLLPPADRPVGLGLSVTMWLINVSSTVAFLWPAVILADQPSVALLLGGFMWMFGVYVHISNTFVALPVYNWSQMIPAFLTAMAVFVVAEQTTFQASPPMDWWLAAGLMVIYAVNTFETLNTQKDTRAALDAARAQAQARLATLEHLNRHDPLTGLLTRAAFDLGLAQMLARARDGWHVGVFVIDLDGFKPINDTYSHQAGDMVLRAVGERLAALAGKAGLVARLGGDEFALAADSLRSERAGLWLADQILRDIRQPIDWGEKTLTISASIGIGLSGQAGDTVSDLCAAADQAMYRAKGSGVRAVAYRADDFPRRLTLEDRRALADALRLGQIKPHYQPKVRLDSGRIVGLEALARWHHPERGLVSPGQFLPQLNELGLQGDFMTAITGQVLRDVESLLKDGLDPGQVSVNLPEVALATTSGRNDLHRLMASHPAAARHITLEITEDVFIARSGTSIQAGIAEFRATGLRVSLDDFGTGFASFQHLRSLEFDELKIAPGFVADLGRDRAAEVLVRGFLNMAAGLGVSVIAEGVETEAQRQHLLAMGGVVAQGYLFGRAQPLDETRIRLAAEAMRDAVAAELALQHVAQELGLAPGALSGDQAATG